jgi:hypothetical protein
MTRGMRRAHIARQHMFFALCTLLAGATVSVHSDLPQELHAALINSIAHQTGIKPEVTRHHIDEDTLSAKEHARSVWASARADHVLIVRFDPRAQKIEAALIDRPGRIRKTLSVELARGALPRLISIDALARAAFPKLENAAARVQRERLLTKSPASKHATLSRSRSGNARASQTRS